MEPYWSEAINGHAPHSVKYESEAAVSNFPYCTDSTLNFQISANTYSEDDTEYTPGRRNKSSRQDPLSHRIIEKRRRDRMNSCLADLSRLIPPQYQRKGRGRIEKTEIIEMAIRHLKHLQSECMQKENEYRLGYTECMNEAAKFLYESQMQDFCYRMIARLQDHCDELIKNDCLKPHSYHAPIDSVSASSGSPPQAFHPVAPLCQLRDMLGTSDIEHSNDHSDVKDLSFRNHLNQLQLGKKVIESFTTNAVTDTTSTGTLVANDNSVASSIILKKSNNNKIKQLSHQPQQAPVITSTAPSSLHQHLTDSSNHDFDSSREPLLQTETSSMHSPTSRDTTHRHHLHHASDSLQLQSNRMRNFSESSHDIEHNNRYKYKNHIKERFNHELHDEETSSDHCLAPPLLPSEHSHTHSMSEHSKDGTEPDVAPIIVKKRKHAKEANCGVLDDTDAQIMPPTCLTTSALLLDGNERDEKPFRFSDIKSELTSHKLHSSVLPSSTTIASSVSQRSFGVPIFALHVQGTYYVPLSVDYSVLLPYLNGLDLLERNYTMMPLLHPININVNFMPPTPSASLLAVTADKPSSAVTPSAKRAVSTTAVDSKMKLGTITNGW